MLDLIDRLRACGAEVSARLPNLNEGGCGPYAAHVAMALDDLGLTVWAVVSSAMRDDDLHVVRNEARPHTLHQWNCAGVLMNHVVIQIECGGTVWTHDAANTTDEPLRRDPTHGAPLCLGYLTVPELVTIAAARKGWNPTFNRQSGVPVIRAAVKRHLRE